ncbi:MAG TPA: C40 family peptidase [Chitinophagaceae bacterium]
MEYAIVKVPAAPVRRKPNHRREMVNQLLFGEAVQILKEKGSLWVKVRSLFDKYEGWMTNTLLEEVTEEEAKADSQFLTAEMLNLANVNTIQTILPIGASLPGYQDNKGAIGRLAYEFYGQSKKRTEQQPDAALLIALTQQWLNAPYLWGGRTIFGVDCSGFVQVNYKMLGVDLPRDAWQQAQEGKSVKKINDAAAGDLAFFDDKEEIVHVGILLDASHIIHASGKVRIDIIDKKGIINSDTGQRTHSLKAIRRFW